MQSKLLDRVIFFLEEAQAFDIKIIDVSQYTSITDHMIICTGRSSRHVRAIAESIVEQMKKDKFVALSQNGLNNGEWALVDFGDLVLHVMQAEIREFYNIEDLWL